ncbi:FxSxx-COOH cyclophane-containing RiPP peptide [Streptomyces sp. NPDC048507]|uniref:FxSxx-COOH cyclophane-containing RiPP peptide n=1 Tax=Streptomyces sp. NPDC048507 TaxID=3365560 RepID=UPI0037101215
MGCGRVKSTLDGSNALVSFPPISHGLPEDGVVNTSATPPTSTVKNRRVPLAQIDVRSASAAAALGRVLPSESRRHVQAPIFNSAL